MLDAILRWASNVLFNPKYFLLTTILVVLGDAVLSQLIIRYVPCRSFPQLAFGVYSLAAGLLDTEIDFETYMFQVELYQNGERDYSKIVGPTGPLVYPAGHVFIHDFLSKLTNKGLNLRLAQHIYSLIYLVSLTTTCLLYRKAGGIPNYVLLLLPLSKRLHSIFMLRLFNDCWALIFLQNAALAFIYDFNSFGAVLFSVALSIKMSVLLYVPGIMVLCFKKMGLMRTLLILAIILNVQFIIGYPFLTTYPSSYIASAFELSRVFLYKWTVNWRFVPEDIFLSKTFAMALLFLHLFTLASFAAFKWCSKEGGVIKVLLTGLTRPFIPPNSFVTSDEFLTVLFTSNLLGIMFARSLHYQFYSWYAQQVPFLLWRTTYPFLIKVLLFICIEYAWNIFPSTVFSSALLAASHLVLLAGIWYGYPQGIRPLQTSQKKNV